MSISIEVLNVNPSGHGMNGAVLQVGGGKCRTLTTNKGEGFKIIEPVCIHQVGRYPENPKSKQVGLPTEQMFEEKEMDGKCGTLTTVQKDNLIGEMIPLCITPDGKSQTIKSQSYKNSLANFVGHEGTFGATGVAERIPEYGNPDKSRPVEALYANHAGTGEGSIHKRLCSDNPAKQQVDLIAEKI